MIIPLDLSSINIQNATVGLIQCMNLPITYDASYVHYYYKNRNPKDYVFNKNHSPLLVCQKFSYKTISSKFIQQNCTLTT
jgi:hypothetical protein